MPERGPDGRFRPSAQPPIESANLQAVLEGLIECTDALDAIVAGIEEDPAYRKPTPRFNRSRLHELGEAQRAILHARSRIRAVATVPIDE